MPLTQHPRVEGAADLPAAEVRRRFEAVVFDWDGTAVPDRSADAGPVRAVIEALCAAGLDLFVVSGTNVRNVDGQLRARPNGPGQLYLLLNRGSEVFRVDRRGPHLVERRSATPKEHAALDVAARLTIERLAARGLHAEVVAHRLNRRKIDVIPEPEWADPPKARIAELLEAVEGRLAGAGLRGLPEVVEMAETAAREAGLPDPRVTSDAKHVEIGLTDKSHSGEWIFRTLDGLGIPPEQVMVAGDEFGPLGGLPGSDSLMLVPASVGATAVTVGAEPEGVPDGILPLGGGPPTFLTILDDQVARRARGDLPEPRHDGRWTISVDGVDPRMERVHESLLTLADGRVGTSGTPLALHPAAVPGVLAAGIYDGEGSDSSLLTCPVWAQLSLWLDEDEDDVARVLDLRTGLLHEEARTNGVNVRSVRFSSLARPGLGVLRTQTTSASVEPKPAPSLPPGLEGEQGRLDGVPWARLEAADGGVATAVRDAARHVDGSHVTERFAAYVPDPDRRPRRTRAVRTADQAAEEGFERLLREHRVAWGRRWEDADVRIEGDDDLTRQVRLALFHLMGSVADEGEAAVGARGLTGAAYRGHVFWDSDVFVLPFLAATHPPAARAMLEYRIRRLPAARAIANVLGRKGARFPWESAHTGFDVTPQTGRDRMGNVFPIRTGLLEEHIVADVAWAACCYADWSGDSGFLQGPGFDLVVDTARYWASRVRWDRMGTAHIFGVIGPDEYHESVDDNAFTNVMARWNLRRAAALAEDDERVPEFERLRWLETADALIDGYDRRTKRYEQCAGFYQLEPLRIDEIAPKRPIAADLLLGADVVRGAQILKQADVLMLHHLVPDEVAPGSLVPNLDYYEPRTAHGSSLSPGIHASLFARAGRLDDAVRALDIAARIDLEDLTGTSAGGLHLAAMGSVWQALAFGFVGARPKGEVLELDPRVPESWGALEMRLRFRDARIWVRVEPMALEIRADRQTRIRLRGATVVTLAPGVSRRWARSAHRWKETRS
ncbi:MAG TPA: glycosyl hydrolase family 65 protein [Actinomycetota bacterium]|nr:glycosyl hydrolase family 65 protein [Actinomycetota bacterium]